ncbi:hypothetical protein ES332_A13G108100v1 [Gossypium tomentosum]|uniref:Uncharacterized protein n=1 Tax=Gossypium tomentosum TaxID=34277 RepID=A0A5D2MIK2_GOSTO|nr:hypothetical protein ES332_A13G108100v1 [Gossypium tomentosum]
MEEEKGTTGSINLSLNGKEEKINLSGQVHNLPCCIKFNGPCIVSQYFKPKLKNNSGKRKACDVSEGNSNDWEMKAKFDKLTYLNHDTPPSKDDPFLHSFHWFTIAEAVSNIIFIDSPVGTGFSYARNNRAAQTGDLKQVHHLHQFLRKTGVNKLVDLVGVTLGPKGMNVTFALLNLT